MPVVPEICGDGRQRARRRADDARRRHRRRPRRDGRRTRTGSRPPTSRCTSPRAATAGAVEARAHVLRAGRTTVVIEVTLHNDLRPGRRRGDAADRDRDDELRGAAPPRHQPRHHRDAARVRRRWRSRAPRSPARCSSSSASRPSTPRRGVVELPVARVGAELDGRDAGRRRRRGRRGRGRGRAASRDRPSRSSSPTCSSRTWRSARSVRCARASTCSSATRRTRSRAVELVDTGAGDRQMTLARAVATRSLA